MDASVRPADSAFEDFLRQQERKSLLRFIACGSVDHGKSTLLGRLLYEATRLFEDQLTALEAESRKHGTQGDELDFSLLLDGLAAEREQKITIDVAYRFFSTERRKFIVIDAPGHEQYTPNTATGASMADVALILVDARSGITRQTKRHALLLSTLGVRQVVLAVNKMDLVGWSEETFRAIAREFGVLANSLGVVDVTCIPVAAKSGDNVASASVHMPWYRGATLLDYLETVEIAQPGDQRPFRMPVQWVNRPNPEFRGLSGMITSGEPHVGMPVRVLPSGRLSRIERIVTFDGDLDRAQAGRSVTLVLTDDLDASRGDIVAEANDLPDVADAFSARVFWMDKQAAAPGRSFLMKIATATALATIEPGLQVIDLDHGKSSVTDQLVQNEIGICTLTIDREIAVDRYAAAKDTGSFILIDPDSYATVGMGCVEETNLQAAPLRARLAAWIPQWIPFREDAASAVEQWTSTHARSLAKAVIWRLAASVITFALVYWITGSSRLAASIAAAETMIKILIYYCHERMWTTIHWGKRS